MKNNLLVTLADRNYVDQAKQLFSGVYWNAGWKGDYMLLSHGIPESELSWFREKGILVRECRSVFQHGNKNARPDTVFSKFYIFTPEFRKWKNVVFLDADVIVRSSLERLTRTSGFSAHKNMTFRECLAKPGRFSAGFERKENARKLYDVIKKEYGLESMMFNSGVMAFSTDIIDEETFSRLTAKASRYAEVNRYGEQLILNMEFSHSCEKLPFIYNSWPCYLTERIGIKPDKIKSSVLHFIKGENKPWIPGNPFREEWERNLEMAEGIDLRNIPDSRRSLDDAELDEYKRYLRERHRKNYRGYLKWKIYPVLSTALCKTDRLSGMAGIFLRKHSPSLYLALKSVDTSLRRKFHENT